MSAPYDIVTELWYDGAWQDISADVLQTDDIKMRWGRADEASVAAPNELSLQLNNGSSNVAEGVSGRYSPRNPRSDLFGKVGRNTPLRVRLGTASPRLVLGGYSGSYASTPDASDLDITGDIDVRVEVEPTTWRPPQYSILAAKYEGDGKWSWVFYRNADGNLLFSWTTGGSSTTRVTKTSTAAVSESAGRIAVRVTLDVNNGSSGNTVAFYTATAIDGSWTQLGSAVVTASTTSIFSGSAPLTVGAGGSGDGVFSDGDPFAGNVYAFELRSGIAGTVVASADFTALEVGAGGSFVDDAGLEWTISPTAHIDDPASVRMAAEITTMPTEWDVSGNNVWVPVRAKSITRRLGQGAAPLRSSLFRDLSHGATTVAYWPMEDGRNATTVAAADGGPPLVVSGDVTMAGYSGFAGSAPVPTFGSNAHMSGTIPIYTAVDRQRIGCMLHQTDGMSVDCNLLAFRCTGGTISQVILVLKSDGSLRLVLRDLSGTNVLDTSGSVGDLRDENAMVWVLLNQDGSDIDWQFGKIAEGETSGTIQENTLAGYTYGRYESFVLGSNSDLAGTALGHLHLTLGDDDAGFWNTASTSLVAWDGETAGNRIIRLAGEEDMPLVYVGDPDDTEQMGPQGRKRLLDLLKECAEADMGILDDHTRLLAKRYRDRSTLYNQDVTLTLDYSAGQVAPDLRPVPDDQALRNDVTVDREDGGSARSIQLSGPLNVRAPTADPQGVGRYDDSITLLLYSDFQLPHQAGWRRRLGTIDEDRYPSIKTDLRRNSDLLDSVRALDPGDRVQVTNPPDWLPPETIDQIAQGGVEVLNTFRHQIELVCTPASPWTVAVASDDESRAASDGSTVAHDFVSGTDTSMVVATGYFEDFEDGSFVTPITGTWVRTDDTSHAGSWSLGSPDVDDDEHADAVVTIPPGTREVSFWYKASSEEDFDVLEVYLDDEDTAALTASGDTGWVEADPIDVVGRSTITFRYVKDESLSEGSDAAYIDDLHFSSVSRRHPPWTTDEDDLPLTIKVAGVELEVTAISGTSSPQTFTVTAAPVNGIEKTIPAGSEVQIARPMHAAL